MDPQAELPRFASTLVTDTNTNTNDNINDNKAESNTDDLSVKEQKFCVELKTLKESVAAEDLAAEAYKLLYLYKALLIDVNNNDPIAQNQVFKHTMKTIELRAEEIMLLMEDRVDALKK